MGRTYGGRWETICTIGTGGQSEVFRVSDLRDPAGKAAALKWIKNPKRRPRFENEVTAIRRLDHPNVIKLLDHSAFDNLSGQADRQFLVMPEAVGGDLSKRAAAMGCCLDTTLIIAKQLSSALAVAHGAGIIHRDVKPQNILFENNGNNIWLADFGICLITEMGRPTEAGEVAGPWAFMAPELEAGGQLEVTPSADVYSLGKVIYYMVSGGVVLPRERLEENQFSQIFSRGGRFRLLEILLSRMICSISNRIGDMNSVTEEIENILNWDRTIEQIPFRPEALAKLEKLKKTRLEAQRAAEREQEDEAAFRRARDLISSEIHERLLLKADMAAKSISVGPAMEARSNSILEHFIVIPDIEFRPHKGVELVVEIAGFNKQHRFLFLICNKITFRITHTGSATPAKTETPIYILPLYHQKFPPGVAAGKTESYYYIKTNGRLFNIPPKDQPQTNIPRQPRPQNNERIHCLEVIPSNWPSMSLSFDDFISTVFGQLIDILEQNATSPFFA